MESSSSQRLHFPQVTFSNPPTEAILVHLWHMAPNSLCKNTSYVLLVTVQSLHKQKLSWFPFAKTARGQPTQWGASVLLSSPKAPHATPRAQEQEEHTASTTWQARRGTNSRVTITSGKLSYFQTRLLHKHNLAELPVQACCSGEQE